jgi:transporter family protein
MEDRRISMGFFTFVILTIIFWGIAPIFGKIGLVKVEPIVGLAIRTFIISIILFSLCLFTGKFSSFNQVTIKDVLFIGAEGICASLLGHFAYYYALKLGDVSKVSPLLAAYPVVTVLAAILLLGEKFTWNKFIGLIAIVAGVILVKR